MIIRQYCKSKMDVVSYVGVFLKKLEVADFAWTMTIRPGILEDCYAIIAITDLSVDGEDRTSLFLEELLSTSIGTATTV